eukprot:scaffold28040_cov54-Attheya_sp.AAC.3
MAIDLRGGEDEYCEQLAPQWIVLPHHDSNDPASAGRARAPFSPKRSLLTPAPLTAVAERMWSWSSGRSKLESNSLGTMYMQPFSSVASLTGIHTLSSFGVFPSSNIASDAG